MKKTSKIIKLLDLNPYEVHQKEKNEIFIDAMQESLKHHYKNSKEFKQICDNHKFNVEGKFQLEEIPYIPVSIFKKFNLLSIPKENVFLIDHIKVVNSQWVLLGFKSDQQKGQALVSYQINSKKAIDFSEVIFYIE